MNKEFIARRIDEYCKKNVDGIPFDEGLQILRKILWQIADEEGIDGATIFNIYMDWKSKQNE